MNNLPNELIDYIISYLFIYCDHCLKMTHFSDIQKKVIINKYRHIFDDDYHLPKESIFFNIICNKCLKIYFINDNKFIYALINQDTNTKNNKCFCNVHNK